MKNDDVATKTVTAIQGVGVVYEHEDVERQIAETLEFTDESFKAVRITPASPATRGGKP